MASELGFDTHTSEQLYEQAEVLSRTITNFDVLNPEYDESVKIAYGVILSFVFRWQQVMLVGSDRRLMVRSLETMYKVLPDRFGTQKRQ